MAIRMLWSGYSFGRAKVGVNIQCVPSVDKWVKKVVKMELKLSSSWSAINAVLSLKTNTCTEVLSRFGNTVVVNGLLKAC